MTKAADNIGFLPVAYRELLWRWHESHRKALKNIVLGEGVVYFSVDTHVMYFCIYLL